MRLSWKKWWGLSWMSEVDTIYVASRRGGNDVNLASPPNKQTTSARHKTWLAKQRESNGEDRRRLRTTPPIHVTDVLQRNLIQLQDRLAQCVSTFILFRSCHHWVVRYPNGTAFRLERYFGADDGWCLTSSLLIPAIIVSPHPNSNKWGASELPELKATAPTTTSCQERKS